MLTWIETFQHGSTLLQNIKNSVMYSNLHNTEQCCVYATCTPVHICIAPLFSEKRFSPFFLSKRACMHWHALHYMHSLDRRSCLLSAEDLPGQIAVPSQSSCHLVTTGSNVICQAASWHAEHSLQCFHNTLPRKVILVQLPQQLLAITVAQT